MARHEIISRRSHAKLRFIAELAGVSTQTALEFAIDRLYRDRFLDECNGSYARLMNDPAAAECERDERKCWDATLSDGLEDA